MEKIIEEVIKSFPNDDDYNTSIEFSFIDMDFLKK
jgi:hypothetical protein